MKGGLGIALLAIMAFACAAGFVYLGLFLVDVGEVLYRRWKPRKK